MCDTRASAFSSRADRTRRLSALSLNAYRCSARCDATKMLSAGMMRQFKCALALLLFLLQAVSGASGQVEAIREARRRLHDSPSPNSQDDLGNTTEVGSRPEIEELFGQNITEVPAGAPLAGAGGGGPKRPFKLRFYDDPGSWDTPERRSYVMDRLMPAIATFLARIIRVRSCEPLLQSSCPDSCTQLAAWTPSTLQSGTTLCSALNQMHTCHV